MAHPPDGSQRAGQQHELRPARSELLCRAALDARLVVAAELGQRRRHARANPARARRQGQRPFEARQRLPGPPEPKQRHPEQSLGAGHARLELGGTSSPGAGAGPPASAERRAVAGGSPAPAGSGAPPPPGPPRARNGSPWSRWAWPARRARAPARRTTGERSRLLVSAISQSNDHRWRLPSRSGARFPGAAWVPPAVSGPRCSAPRRCSPATKSQLAALVRP